MSSPQSDKAGESQHVPASAAVATQGPIPTAAFGERVVGATAIASAALVVIDNAVVAGAPTYGAPIKEVLAFHAENRGAVAIAVGLEALNVPLLLGFLVGLHGLVGRRGGAGADWSRLAMAAGACYSAVVMTYAVCGTVSYWPQASSPSRPRRSSSPGACTRQRSRYRCRHSALH